MVHGVHEDGGLRGTKTYGVGEINGFREARYSYGAYGFGSYAFSLVQHKEGNGLRSLALLSRNTYGGYGFAVPHHSLQALRDWWAGDLGSEEPGISPDLSWFDLAHDMGKRIFATHPLLVKHLDRHTDSWNGEPAATSGDNGTGGSGYHALHGVNHPLVSIQLGRNPLVATGARTGELGGVVDTSVELTFDLIGLLPGFTYDVLVHELDQTGKWRTSHPIVVTVVVSMG